MSVDAEAHVDITGQIIMTFVKSHSLVESVELHNPTIDLDYQILWVKMQNSEIRTINVHNRSGIFGSTLLTTGSNGDLPRVLEDMVITYGGVYDDDDCDDIVDLFVTKDQANYAPGNAEFVLKWALAKGYINNTDEKACQIAYSKFREERNS